MQSMLNRIIEINKQIVKNVYFRNSGNPTLLTEIRELTNESSEFAFQVLKQSEKKVEIKNDYVLNWIDTDDKNVKPVVGERYLVTIKRRDGYIYWDKTTYHKFGWNISPMCKIVAWCEIIMYQENNCEQVTN